MKTIISNDAPLPAGHYSQAIVHQDLIYVSGQMPINPKIASKHVGSIEDQTKQALRNLETILKSANSDKNHVLKVTVYISDIALWDRVNSVYAEFFEGHRPARSIVPTRELHFGYQIEIDDAISAVIKNGA